MEVTKSNFNSTLPIIKESINKATFLTIDCEFSGLNTGNEINAFDSQKLYYQKIRRGCKDFLLLQYGLCSFRYDKDKKSFSQKAYNFYIFPKVVSKYVPDQRFLCQVSSINFLMAQDFDFNKLFKEGIPYLNSIQESKYREALIETQKIRTQSNFATNCDNANKVVVTKEADKIFLENVSDQIKSFLNSDEEELFLPKCNGFLRLLIYQTVRENFNDKLNIQTKSENRERIMVVTKYKSADDRKLELNKLMDEEYNELENTIGFTKVIKHLIESRKLIVGHNMVLDLLHTMDKFLAPLPEPYEEFKECVHSVFPMIVDTKYLSYAEPFSSLVASNVLGHLLETVTKPPFVNIKIDIEASGFGYKINQRKEHEAAYDAYITGVCFLAMWTYLGQDKYDEDDIFENVDLLKPYLNKLFLMRLQDCPYIQLDGEDAQPPRDHVFHLTFPKEWKSSDISQLFSPFGGVHIAWINSTSAYVGLIKRQEAAVALSTLSQSDAYAITTYAKKEIELASLPSILKSPVVVRKRSSDGYINKRRKTSGKDIPHNRSIDPVIECQEVDDEFQKSTEEDGVNIEAIPIAKPLRKRTISKTFEEDNSWD